MTIIEVLKSEDLGYEMTVKFRNREIYFDTTFGRNEWRVVERNRSRKEIISTPNEEEAVAELLKG